MKASRGKASAHAGRGHGRMARRPLPYDPDLPLNWTAGRMKSYLEAKGVHVPTNTRRPTLIRMLRGYMDHDREVDDITAPPPPKRTRVDLVGRTPAVLNKRRFPEASAGTPPEQQDRHRERAPDADTDNVNNNGGAEAVLYELEAMKNAMKSLADRISAMEQSSTAPRPRSTSSSTTGRVIPAALGRPPSRADTDDAPQPQTYQSAMTVDTAMTATPSTYNLGSALAHHSDKLIVTSTANYVRTKYGFAAESLPFVETVSPQLRKQITEGKDVNLAALLIPYFTGSNVEDKRPDPRLNNTLTIGEFIQAFGIYKNVMCEAFPQRRHELDLYERDIIDMSARYGSKGFYEYHKHFSLKAAAHLRYQNIAVDWSVRNNTLFCNIFADQKPTTCHRCHSTSHGAGFCPQLTSPNQDMTRRSNTQNDGFSRSKQFYQGKEICILFNCEKDCLRPKCHFLHVCLICKKGHSRIHCPEPKNYLVPRR